MADYPFKELFQDVNIVRKERGVIVSSKEYEFKTVMERFMLKEAVKIAKVSRDAH